MVTRQDLAITEDPSAWAVRHVPASAPPGITLTPNPPNTIKTSVLDLSPGGVKPQTLEIRLPQGLWHPTHAVYSPAGQRAAWFALQQEPTSALMRFWFFPTLYRELPPLASLWVSGLQGQGLRRIAFEDYRAPSPGKYVWEGSPQMLSWLPDGKTLSFVHDAYLWTIGAD